jgi:hypothetical protein
MLRFQLFSTNIAIKEFNPFIPITSDLKWYIPVGLIPYSFWNQSFYTLHFLIHKYIPTKYILNDQKRIGTIDLRGMDLELIDTRVHPERRQYTLNFIKFLKRTSVTEKELRKITNLPIEEFYPKDINPQAGIFI